MTCLVAFPPDLYFPTLVALQGAGMEATPEQVVDLLVSLGLMAIGRHPDLIEFLDSDWLEGPWMGHSSLRVPTVGSQAIKALAESATAALGRPVGATALGHLPFADLWPKANKSPQARKRRGH